MAVLLALYLFTTDIMKARKIMAVMHMKMWNKRKMRSMED